MNFEKYTNESAMTESPLLGPTRGASAQTTEALASPRSAACSHCRGEAIATIGSFDGVHRGHRSLLAQVRSIADERGLKAVAITFATSPRGVLGKGSVPVLNTTEERTTLLRLAGMDEVVMLDFTSEMAAMSARDFMQQVLRERLHVAVLVIGYDHRFGRGRSETFEDYVRYGQELGIDVVRGEACTDKGEPISSTRIRSLINVGNVEEANLLLGYQYTLQGEVVSGYQEGRKMGFPTANIRPLCNEKLLPADGVYAVWVYVEQQSKLQIANCDDESLHPEENNFQFSTFNAQFKGMLNIGYRPTLNNGKERSIEVHILDYDGSLYGKSVTVEFAHRLREERMFRNTEELTKQLRQDKERVRKLLGGE